jgi:hypothetical protein
LEILLLPSTHQIGSKVSTKTFCSFVTCEKANICSFLVSIYVHIVVDLNLFQELQTKNGVTNWQMFHEGKGMILLDLIHCLVHECLKFGCWPEFII